MGIKILHTGDLQLGYAQYGIPERKADFNTAAGVALEAAKAAEAQCVVLAGDLFEVPEPPASSVRALQEAVRRCKQNNIPVLGVYGNHDRGDAADEGWLAVCGIQDLQASPVQIDDTLIGGLHFTHNSEFEGALAAYLDSVKPLDVLVIHQAFAEFTGFPVPLTAARTAEIIKESKSADTCKLVLMGDIHIADAKIINGVAFNYCGATEWNSSSESEIKTVSLVSVGNGRPPKIERLPIQTREIMRYAVTDPDQLDELRELVQSGGAAFYYVEIAAELRQLKPEVKEILRAKLHRIRDIPKTGTALHQEILATKGQGETSKSTSAVALRETLDNTFDAEDPRKDLILRLLDGPKSTASTTKKYIQEKLCTKSN